MGKFNSYETLDKYIEEGNKKQLQFVITGLISIDRNFKNNLFYDALSYVEENFGEIYEEYDGRGLISNTKEKFTNDDLNLALVRLQLNFCKKRKEDVEKISKELYCDTNGIEGTNKSDEKKTIITQMNQSKPSQMSKKQEKKIGVVGWILLGIGAAATVITIVEIVKHLKK